MSTSPLEVMTPEQLLARIRQAPESIEFGAVMATIARYYQYQPTAFVNGKEAATQVVNAAGSNEGSCRIFAFAKLHGLTQTQTLACFGAYYRDDVLKHPEGSDHANIRTFMRDGWEGLSFAGEALVPATL